MLAASATVACGARTKLFKFYLYLGCSAARNCRFELTAVFNMERPPAEMSVLLSDVRADRTFVDFSLAMAPTPTLRKATDIIVRMEVRGSTHPCRGQDPLVRRHAAW